MRFKQVGFPALSLAVVLMTPGTAAALERIVTNVYFEWGETTLDAKALEAVSEALPKARECEYNGVRVFGHADRSHTEAESTALAMTRALAVREELMKLGIANGAIAFSNKGELDPAIETADGVREPLNRRVEIIVVCD
jgi:outer membrane protein OmpA-like peptidoglycan-associated protein